MSIEYNFLLFMTTREGFPPELAALAAGLIIILLGIGAAIDHLTGYIPDGVTYSSILISASAAVGQFGLIDGGVMIAVGAAFYVIATIVLEVIYRVFRVDIFGQGDVKWLTPIVILFGIDTLTLTILNGSILAAAFLCVFSVLRMAKARIWTKMIEGQDQESGYSVIHFAPFLLIGFLLSIF